jgi:hypothetical protein
MIAPFADKRVEAAQGHLGLWVWGAVGDICEDHDGRPMDDGTTGQWTAGQLPRKAPIGRL